MSTIDSLNSVKQQLTDLGSASTGSASLGGEAFDKALDLAMEYKGAVLPAPASVAVDLGVDALKEGGLLTASTPTTIKDSIESVFDELSLGIATSFVAAMSGEDSATEVFSKAAPTSITTESLATSAESIVADTLAGDAIISNENITSTKEVLSDALPLMVDKKTVPMANTALSALEDILLDDEDENKLTKS